MSATTKLLVMFLAIAAYVVFIGTPEDREKRGDLNDRAMEKRSGRIDAIREAIKPVPQE